MGLEQMIRTIHEEAEEEARKILDEAEKKARLIGEREAMETRRMVAELEEKLDKESRTLSNINLSEGKRKARQALLSAKEDLIWETISSIRSHLSSMEGDELLGYLLRMYDKAHSMLGNGMIVYPVRVADASALEGKPNIRDPLETMNVLPPSVSRFKGKDLIGGFLAVSSDGRKVVDMTFQGMLEKKDDRIREIIARTLFGD
ncbi:MAG TPA: hypothetical protein ENK47_00210 [Euryarchaeota archaeon]|nr:MAG: hypothetical protein B6U90_01070 [Thermoplasmatales archaeon ex4484_6]RLF68885.1 MAG: hypothetical protein DRN57_02600 [Thermoplasmata archaeon]HHD15111.1 hypothetical protein [Euryarchaeota archaeon]